MANKPEKSDHKQAVQTAQRAMQLVKDSEAALAKVAAHAPAAPPTLGEGILFLGVPGLVITAGYSVAAFHFPLGIIIGCTGCVSFFIGALYFYRKRLSVMTGLIWLVLSLTFLAPFIWLWYRPAPLELTALSMPGGYAKGALLAGIQWESQFSEARILIENRSDTSYTEIKGSLRTDLTIAAMGSLNKVSNCHFQSTLPGVEIAAPTVSRLGKDGNIEETTPLVLNLATVYQLYCDRLNAHDKIELVLALSAPKPRTPAHWVSADVEYDAFSRTRSATPLRQCLADRCGPILGPDEHP